MRPFQDPQIDHDHDQVIAHLETLSRLTTWSPAGRQDHLQLIQQLLDYVAGHFQREETVMAAAGYPGLAAHAAAHAAMAADFRRLAAALRATKFSVPAELRLLRGVFLAHIVTWDEAFGQWLAEADRPCHPPPAAWSHPPVAS